MFHKIVTKPSPVVRSKIRIASLTSRKVKKLIANRIMIGASTPNQSKESFFVSNTSGIIQFFKRNAVPYMFLTPWLLGFLVLTVYPMVYSLWLGFTDYDFTEPDSTQWIGIGNYLKMFGLSKFTASTGEAMRADPYYLKSLSITFTYVFVSVPLKLIFALAVAVLMLVKVDLKGCLAYPKCPN